MRVHRFSFFAFTSSPCKDKKLMNNNLDVKAKEDLPSPVKNQKALHIHPQITSYQSIRGEGEGWRQELPTRWVRDAQGRVRLSAPTRVRDSCEQHQRKRTRFLKKEVRLHTKQEENRKKVHHFSLNISLTRDNIRNSRYKHTNIRQKCFTYAIDKTQPPFSCRSAAASI